MGVDRLLIAKITRAPLFRFLLVGGAAFIVDAAIVWGLTYIGVDAYLARIASLCVSIVFSFVLNRQATFSVQGNATWQEFGAYIGASGIGVGINYGLYAGGLKLGWPWLMAMMVGTGVASAFNFFAYGRIFRGSAR